MGQFGLERKEPEKPKDTVDPEWFTKNETAEGKSRLGGVAKLVADEIHERTGRETRELVLGHLQRGGGPNAYDRLLALRFGAAAVQLVKNESYGSMVALDPPEVLAVPLADAIAKIKTVPLNSDVVATARALGVCLGDRESSGVTQ